MGHIHEPVGRVGIETRRESTVIVVGDDNESDRMEIYSTDVPDLIKALQVVSTGIDWRDLFKRYAEHVCAMEGIDFLQRWSVNETEEQISESPPLSQVEKDAIDHLWDPPPNAPGFGQWLTEEHLAGNHEEHGSSACGLCGWRP